MNFTLKIMGTASAMPISDRNPSAQVLSVHGRLFLIDCGEGTQQQLRRARMSFLKIDAIFISHIHGDHLFGIFGLLSSMAMYGRTADLHVYGPQALGSVLNFYRSFFSDESDFRIVFHAVKCGAPETVMESRHVKVSAFPLNHKIECYGWRFDELPAQGRPCDEDGLPAYPLKSFAYCSDTAPFPELADWVRGVDLLYHEATYTRGMSDKAALHHHSTTEQAARCAAEAGAGRLVVGHYSSRITDFDAYRSECREIFPATTAAQDGDVFEF